MRWPGSGNVLHHLDEWPACCGQAPRSVLVRVSWLVRLVMALRSVPGPCGRSAHGAVGIVVLVVLDVLGRAGRRAPSVGRVVGVLRPTPRSMAARALWLAPLKMALWPAGLCGLSMTLPASLVVLDALARSCGEVDQPAEWPAC